MSDAINLETAKTLIEAAGAEAESMGLRMVITVANPEGSLIAQHRVNDAWLASVNVSRNKAYTVTVLQMPTHELTEGSQPGESLWGLQTADENRLVVFGGDCPLEIDGELVGTVGVSDGEVSEDMVVAGAAVERFEELVE